MILLSTTPTTTASSVTSDVTNSSIPDGSRASYSGTISALIALSSAILFGAYLCSLIITYRYARSNPRGLNKPSGVHLQRYAPALYVFLVMSSLMEVSLSSWLLIQYTYFGSSPNDQTRTAASLILFCACWTSLTGGIYGMLFLHPRYAEHPVASVGAQLLWVFTTWLMWIVGAGLLNGALPRLLLGGHCIDLLYCGQIRGLFALAVIEILTLTAGLCVLFWLIGGPLFHIRWPLKFGNA